MNVSTLITKVMLPRRRGDLLRRQRLLNRLYGAVEHKLVLVSAPAGYGKTTLLVDFAHDLQHPVCWYALDHSDRDPRVFLEHLVLSLHHRFPGFGEQTRRALASNPDLSDGAPGVVNVLINEMVESIPQWFVLVLDDHHRLGNAPEVDAIVARFLRYQPDQVLLIIASRNVPQLPLIVQLAAKGEVEGIGEDELRFRADEIQQLLAQNHDLHVPDQEAKELAAQSEGWITGILLTTHTLWQGILRGLTQARTSDRPVYEYLAQEVFAQQQPAVQTFLTASSTLEEMSPDLCRDALGLEDAGACLSLLKDRNLFVTQLEESWYRYHHLFQDYLQEQLQRDDRARWVELHRRAAGWFESHEQPSAAVHHYLTVEAYEDAVRVMEAAARDVFVGGRLKTLMDWCAALPDDLREHSPRLALFQSRAAEMMGRWEEALALADLAERGYRAGEDSQGLAYVLLQRCKMWQQQGRSEDALALGQSVATLVEETQVPVGYEVRRMLGLNCVALGQLEEGEQHLRQALALSQVQGSDYARASVLGNLADCLWRQGRWVEAVTVQRQAVETQRRRDNPAELAGTLNDLGFYLYSTGEHGEALRLFEQALQFARESGHRRDEAFALISLGELSRDLGALERAQEACEEGLAIADELGHGFLSAYGREALGLVHRCRGNYALARVSLEGAIARARAQHSNYQLGRYSASLGLIQAESGETEAGLTVLARAQEQLEQIGAQGESVRADIFAAWALFQAGNRAEALAALGRVFETTDGPCREFVLVVEGQRMLTLLEQARAEEVGGAHLEALLSRVQAFQQAAEQELMRTPLAGAAPTQPLRISALGRGRVERDGEEIPLSEWGGAATRQLLFYLLTHTPLSRDQIAAVLWPDAPPHKVKTAFHTTKFRLKRALGQEALYFDGYCYQVHPDLHYWYDVQEFERLLSGTEPGRRVGQLREAVALYQGDFLEDHYADWCMQRREVLRERHLAALDELAGRLLARRQYHEAIQVLHTGLELDNLRERLYRQLMRAYVLCGQRDRAVSQYQRCATLLQDELGTTPSPETTALCQRIRDGLPLD
jgi:LuxR family maltose regulon positive regulatory protein